MAEVVWDPADPGKAIPRKNEMGIQRSYPRAQEGLRSAAEVGGVVLKYLKDSALNDDPTPVSRVVVAVSAPFQAAQRADTQKDGSLTVQDGAAVRETEPRDRVEKEPERAENDDLLDFL